MKCKNTDTDEFMDDMGEDLCTESNMSWELEEVSCATAEMYLFMDPSNCYLATTQTRQICCIEPGDVEPCKKTQIVCFVCPLH